jgi:nicotinamidase/pyrazinamidase
MAGYDSSTALVVTDVQNDFADPHGSLYVRDGELVVPLANHEIGRVIGANGLVLYTQDWHPEHTPHFKRDGGIWPVHCVRDTWGAAFHPLLQMRGDIVRKGTGGEDGYSGFSVRDPATGRMAETEMEPLLLAAGIQRVVILGLATDYCVKETALDAIRRGFGTVVLTEAIRAVDLRKDDGARALEEMTDAGVALE